MIFLFKLSYIEKEEKEELPPTVDKSPEPADVVMHKTKEPSPDETMEVDETKEPTPEKASEPEPEILKLTPKVSKTPKRTKPKELDDESVEPESKFVKHTPEIVTVSSELKQVEVIEKNKEKPDEVESVFVRGQLKKATRIKRAIEKPELETVELVSHAAEPQPASELVSVTTMVPMIPTTCRMTQSFDILLYVCNL